MHGTEDINDVTRGKRIVEIYETYVKIISPFIIQLETLDGEFPVEILNEIRSIFTHISRCCLDGTPEVYEDNITKAERHVKRAILDCYKHVCVAYDEEYKRFDRLYKNVDLSVVDNGDFLTDLCLKRKLAVQRLQEAKRLEVSHGADEEVYARYAEAYDAYSDVYNLIDGSHSKLEKARRRASKRDIFAGVFGVFGVVGTIFTILSFFILIRVKERKMKKAYPGDLAGSGLRGILRAVLGRLARLTAAARSLCRRIAVRAADFFIKF